VTRRVLVLPWFDVAPRQAWAVWRREATMYKRVWPSTILSGLFDPVIYLLAMGFGLGALVGEVAGVPYVQFLAPGLIASAAMMAATFEVAWNSWIRIHQDRSYEAMLATPTTLDDVVAGELLWATTRAGVYATVMLVVVAAFGLVRSPWALLAPVVAVAGGLLFAILGLAYTASVKHVDQLTFWFTLFLTPQFLFSGIFFPLDGMPAWVRALAWATPLYHLVEAERALVLGHVDASTALHAAIVVAAALVLFRLPARLVRPHLIR